MSPYFSSHSSTNASRGLEGLGAVGRRCRWRGRRRRCRARCEWQSSGELLADAAGVEADDVEAVADGAGAGVAAGQVDGGAARAAGVQEQGADALVGVVGRVAGDGDLDGLAVGLAVVERARRGSRTRTRRRSRSSRWCGASALGRRGGGAAVGAAGARRWSWWCRRRRGRRRWCTRRASRAPADDGRRRGGARSRAPRRSAPALGQDVVEHVVDGDRAHQAPGPVAHRAGRGGRRRRGARRRRAAAGRGRPARCCR